MACPDFVGGLASINAGATAGAVVPRFSVGTRAASQDQSMFDLLLACWHCYRPWILLNGKLPLSEVGLLA